MNKHELYGNIGARTTSKRLGRGIGSGKGKTCGTGGKGQGTRSGKGKIKGFFEGGQVPLTRRLPKMGFTNNFKKVYNEVNISELSVFKAGTKVDEAALIAKGILKKPADYGLKILGNGDLKVALTVVAKKVTKGAKEKIEKAGGKVEVA